MKLWKRLGALALTAALSLGCLTACGQTAAPNANFTAPESVDLSAISDPYKTISGLEGDTVVAKVGEVEITADLMLYWLNYSADSLMQYYSMYGLGTDLPWDTENEGVTLAEEIKDSALNTAALYALIPAMAQKEGLELTGDFQTTLDASMAELETELGSPELTDHYMWYFPLTRETYAELLQTDEYNALLQDSRFGEGTDGYPTDDEVVRYLTEDEQCYFFKHILLMVEETTEGEGETAVTTSNREEQLALAQDLRAQLAASDDPLTLFDQLMNEYSQDTGLVTYPDGYLGSAKDGSMLASNMVDVVEEFCLSAEDYEISEVMENEQGYHGFHIVLSLPVKDNVSITEYRSTYIANQMTQLQDQWLEDNKLVPTAAFENMDPAVIYDALTVLRDAIAAEANAAESENTESGDTSAPAASSSAAG